MSEYFEQPLNLEEVRNRADKHIMQERPLFPATYHFGQGETLYDPENKEIVDFACADDSLGHGEADIVATIQHQSDRLLRRFPDCHSQERSLLAEALIAHTFPGKVRFCDSAMETRFVCLQLLDRFSKSGDKGRIILSNEGGSPDFDVLAQGGPFTIRRIADDEDVLDREFSEHGNEICAILVDPILAASGIRPAGKGFVFKARELAEEHEVPLIFDETELAPGRSGSLFVYENFEIVPDILLLSRGLAAGFSLGALILGESAPTDAGEGLLPDQGTSPVVARVAHETLRLLVGREVAQAVQGLSDYFLRRLTEASADMPAVHEVRAAGLFIGVELKTNCDEVRAKLLENGLLVGRADENTIAVLPPLSIDLERSSAGLDILEKTLKQ